MELYVVIYNEVTLTWKCEWLIPIEWYDYIEMIYDIMNENGLNGMKWIWLYLLLILIRLCTVVDFMIVLIIVYILFLNQSFYYAVSTSTYIFFNSLYTKEITEVYLSFGWVHHKYKSAVYTNS